MTRPDCYLTDSLPQGFETDFRAWVTYDNMAARAHTPEQEAALQDYAQRVLIHGPLTKDNLDAFLDFYRCGAEESEREKRSAEAFREMPRGFDFAVDGPLIWAAFLQTYGIDLRTAQLHWWDFMALFRSLPDECRICKIISYRTEDLFNEILDDFFADLLGEDYDQRLGIDVDDLEDLMQLLADFNAAADPEALERMAALQPIDREAMKDAKSSIPAPIPMPMNREQRRAARRAKA